MINKVTKVGLSYHDVKFGDVEMPKLFAKQGENARAFQFTISDLRGVVPDLANLEMAMNLELRQYRDIVKATPLSLEDDTGVFLIEFPNIALNGTGKYNLVLSQNLDDEKVKNIYTKNGDIVIERNSIFDNEDGGNTLFDLEEFKEALAKQKEYLEQMQLHEKNTNEYKELADKYAKASKESADLSLKIQAEMQDIFNTENERVENEKVRVSQENERETKEDERESTFRQNEEIRETTFTNSMDKQNEIFSENEKSRKAQEELRVNAENARVEVEKARVAAETGRVNAENERVESETLRKSNEVTREENEKNRVSNHTAMQESVKRWSLMMQDWIAAEESRVLSESTRKDLFNQMKKEFDEMMALLGDNPVGNLTQEIQALKGITDKHFKSAVIQGDDLVLIREDMTELVVPLELNKYATVKALEELEALLTSTKTQLEMKIGKKADETYLENNFVTYTTLDEVRQEVTKNSDDIVGKADKIELEKYATNEVVNAKEQALKESINLKADKEELKEFATNEKVDKDIAQVKLMTSNKIGKEDIKVIQDGEVEPTLSDGQILIICEVE